MPLFRMNGSGDTIIQNASGTGTVNFGIKMSFQGTSTLGNASTTLHVSNGTATNATATCQGVASPSTSSSPGVTLSMNGVTGYTWTPTPMATRATRAVTKITPETEYYIVRLDGNVETATELTYNEWVETGWMEAYKAEHPDEFVDTV